MSSAVAYVVQLIQIYEWLWLSSTLRTKKVFLWHILQITSSFCAAAT